MDRVGFTINHGKDEAAPQHTTGLARCPLLLDAFAFASTGNILDLF